MVADTLSKPRRRTQTERTAETRSKLINAAISCLYTSGYSATTMVSVAETAEVSRGAMVYHFPGKVDLMLAVIEHVTLLQDQTHRRMLRDYPRGPERLIGITEVTWRTVRNPEAVALMEIELGSRSDPELAARAPPVFRALDQRRMDSVWEVAADCGVVDRQIIDASTRFYMAAIRGLSMTSIADPSRDIQPAVDMLIQNKRRFVEDLLATKTS
jgi:AcrR family transcriptional regulator